MGSIKDKGVSLPAKTPLKIAAPKPVRARPTVLNHLGNSKWIETSPVKNEINGNENSDLKGKKDLD